VLQHRKRVPQEEQGQGCGCCRCGRQLVGEGSRCHRRRPGCWRSNNRGCRYGCRGSRDCRSWCCGYWCSWCRRSRSCRRGSGRCRNSGRCYRRCRGSRRCGCWWSNNWCRSRCCECRCYGSCGCRTTCAGHGLGRPDSGNNRPRHVAVRRRFGVHRRHLRIDTGLAGRHIGLRRGGVRNHRRSAQQAGQHHDHQHGNEERRGAHDEREDQQLLLAVGTAQHTLGGTGGSTDQRTADRFAPLRTLGRTLDRSGARLDPGAQHPIFLTFRAGLRGQCGHPLGAPPGITGILRGRSATGLGSHRTSSFTSTGLGFGPHRTSTRLGFRTHRTGAGGIARTDAQRLVQHSTDGPGAARLADLLLTVLGGSTIGGCVGAALFLGGFSGVGSWNCPRCHSTSSWNSWGRGGRPNCRGGRGTLLGCCHPSSSRRRHGGGAHRTNGRRPGCGWAGCRNSRWGGCTLRARRRCRRGLRGPRRGNHLRGCG